MNSFLFVPAKEKMMNKIHSLTAHAYIIDLEDSIAVAEKDAALCSLKSFLDDYHSSFENIFVRLNSDRLAEEFSILKNYDKIGFMIPKFEKCTCYDDYAAILSEHSVIALIETPLGILNARDISECFWVDALAFGAEDYTSITNMEKSNKTLLYHKSHIVTCAKAYGKKVYDTPCFSFDEEVLSDEVKNAVSLGFDGKLAINPKQIALINDGFKIKNVDFIRQIIEIYEASNESVLKIDGVVYEKMHIQRLKKILKENREV